MTDPLAHPVSRRFAVCIGVLVILGFCSALALEILVPDEHRTKVSAAILTGRFISREFVRELEVGALGRTVFKVDTVHKADQTIGTNVVVYFEQMYDGPLYDGSLEITGFRSHGVACPIYPKIRLSHKAKVWCVRLTVSGHTNVLFIPSRQWIEPQ